MFGNFPLSEKIIIITGGASGMSVLQFFLKRIAN